MATEPSASSETAPPRRSFLSVVVAVGAGTVAMGVPLAVGIASFLNPLFRKKASLHVRVALLEQVPDDGLPRFFPVITQRDDAWTQYPQQSVGGVYLVRQQGAQKPVAFTAKCPHAGCFIGYSPGDDQFQCPCHTSAFHLDGTRVRGDAEVSPRDMDSLLVTLETAQSDQGDSVWEVWVEFVDYQTGHKEATPSA